ncbi:MAG: hypothetical protein RI989_1280, partial [Bacteroidota bacterium]
VFGFSKMEFSPVAFLQEWKSKASKHERNM